MNISLWIVQIFAALLYAASGVMKIFMFDKISADVESFRALPRRVWLVLGVIELVCVLGLIVPSAFEWHTNLTVWAAALLAIESVIFIGIHVKYCETPSIIISGVLGVVMAFIAYGRLVIAPIA